MGGAPLEVGFYFPEAVEVELPDERGEVVVLEVGGDYLGSEALEVGDVEGLAGVAPTGLVRGGGGLGFFRGPTMGKVMAAEDEGD